MENEVWRTRWGGNGSAEERGVPCLCVCVRDGQSVRHSQRELDRRRQAQATASAKKAQGRITVGIIKLSMMSVIKLRKGVICDNYLHDHAVQKTPFSQLCAVCLPVCLPVCLSDCLSVTHIPLR